jgi:hypothetical protein
MTVFVQLPKYTNLYLAICFILLAHTMSATAATTTGTVSIENTPGYLAQRECVQSALWSGRNQAGQSNIMDWLGCVNLLDSCFCRNDLASSASSLLTSGINSFCSTNSADVAAGISVYNSYCSRTGIDYVPATTTSSDSSTVTVTATQTVLTSTASITSLTSSRELLLVLACAFAALRLL